MIDRDIVYMNLYTPRCGDSGRGGIRDSFLKIDAAAFSLPIAETRGFGTLRATDFDAFILHGGGHGGAWILRG
jgi:hypothetical protein